VIPPSKVLILIVSLAISAQGGDSWPDHQTGGFPIKCKGIMTAVLRDQELLCLGESEFRWGQFDISVRGQAQIYLGVSLKKSIDGVEATPSLQSIAANGDITLSWSENGQPTSRSFRRLVIKPAPKSGGEDLILGSPPIEKGKAPGPTMQWLEQEARWAPVAPKIAASRPSDSSK
jgi:hypothetical protein